MAKRVILGGMALIGGMIAAVLFRRTGLGRIHAGIAATYTRVEHIAAGDFLALNADEYVLFDVRTAHEFAVSHLPGAVMVDPAISEPEFATQFADRLKGKRAIFYCSVGVRSSALADTVAELVEASSGKPPANLIGGIFQWANEGRALVTRAGAATSKIHPYNKFWARLIKDRQSTSHLPER